MKDHFADPPATKPFTDPFIDLDTANIMFAIRMKRMLEDLVSASGFRHGVLYIVGGKSGVKPMVAR